ncbi:MAG: carbohydrate ABC transporter permease [Anaerolineae bacterium]|nr:carbohydrate ABC transporter permease [Anaerolineae bacterium]
MTTNEELMTPSVRQGWHLSQKTISAIMVHAVLLLFLLVALLPIYLMFITSLKTSQELFRSVIALPADPQWQNFPFILIEQGYYRSMINSIMIASCTTILTVVLSILAGFGFAVYRFPGKQVLFIITLIGLMVSEASVLVPVYNLLQDLGLLNTYTGMILPQTALGLAFGIFLITTFFKDIPQELIDAGIIDGCSDLQVLWHVMIPLAKPALTSMALLEFMWAWNSFFFPLVIATKQELMPLSVSIIDFMGRFTFNYEMIATTCVIMSTPILILYLFTQRSFHQGITFGGLKD